MGAERLDELVPSATGGFESEQWPTEGQAKSKPGNGCIAGALGAVAKGFVGFVQDLLPPPPPGGPTSSNQI